MVAPWANNVLHAVAALFAGRESRAAAASLWLLLGIASAWRLARAGYIARDGLGRGGGVRGTP